MELSERIEEVFTSYLEKLGLAWWLEILTDRPSCTYYFGPFLSAKEAELACAGYVEDLQQEGVEGISFEIKQCQPLALTIDGEEVQVSDGGWNCAPERVKWETKEKYFQSSKPPVSQWEPGAVSS
ncbi:DUF1816 domain-containing protein [Kamptonema formosum]|uniref:DUF1816 domain-containing protein n=1 Tax=Kamptonema formosum TaxID=331992 RepID=UPI00034A39E9|nr:DUF1816 domain-containing protein [Oscillatoria sp. PCC 10802]